MIKWLASVEERLSHIGKYRVPVINSQKKEDYALLEPANKSDMNSPHLKEFDWQGIWNVTMTDWEGIVKLTSRTEVLGLIQYLILPEVEPEDERFVKIRQPGFLEIGYLEATKRESNYRLIDPIGKWLLWYAIQVSLRYCEGSKTGTVVGLISKPNACQYYEVKIGMEKGQFDETPRGQKNAFRFSQHDAEQFCKRLVQEYGEPIPTEFRS